jgi:hypothetical protein
VQHFRVGACPGILCGFIDADVAPVAFSLLDARLYRISDRLTDWERHICLLGFEPMCAFSEAIQFRKHCVSGIEVESITASEGPKTVHPISCNE